MTRGNLHRQPGVNLHHQMGVNLNHQKGGNPENRDKILSEYPLPMV